MNPNLYDAVTYEDQWGQPQQAVVVKLTEKNARIVDLRHLHTILTVPRTKLTEPLRTEEFIRLMGFYHAFDGGIPESVSDFPMATTTYMSGKYRETLTGVTVNLSHVWFWQRHGKDPKSFQGEEYDFWDFLTQEYKFPLPEPLMRAKGYLRKQLPEPPRTRDSEPDVQGEGKYANWCRQCLASNAGKVLRRGMRVRDYEGKTGIVVEITRGFNTGDHGGVSVWRDQETEYGCDNCEHYVEFGWQKSLWILEDP